MNLFDIRLISAKAVEIIGESFVIEETETPGFQAKFNAEILTDIESLSIDGTFETKLTFTCKVLTGSDPFFKIVMVGIFQIAREPAITEIKASHGPYQAATLLFPYIRNLSTPILQSLGAADVDFPFYLPPPSEARAEKKPASSRRKTKA